MCRIWQIYVQNITQNNQPKENQLLSHSYNLTRLYYMERLKLGVLEYHWNMIKKYYE